MSANVVCGYTNLRPETREAIERLWPDRHELRDVSYSAEAYHDLLDEYWQVGLDFIVIEHDIVPDERVPVEFEECPEPYCGFGYDVAVGYGVYLGCTRFRSDVLEAVPEMFELTQQETQSGVPGKAWYRIDVRLDQILRQRGYTPHLHMPPVRHLNEHNRLAEPVPYWKPSIAAAKEI